jgi:hypothetical protein
VLAGLLLLAFAQSERRRGGHRSSVAEAGVAQNLGLP